MGGRLLGALALLMVMCPSTARAEKVRVVALSATIDVPRDWELQVRGVKEGLWHRRWPIAVMPLAVPTGACDRVRELGRKKGWLIAENSPFAPNGWLALVSQHDPFLRIAVCGEVTGHAIYASIEYRGAEDEWKRHFPVVLALLQLLSDSMLDRDAQVAHARELRLELLGRTARLPPGKVVWKSRPTTEEDVIGSMFGPSIALLLRDARKPEECARIAKEEAPAAAPDSSGRNRELFVPYPWIAVSEHGEGVLGLYVCTIGPSRRLSGIVMIKGSTLSEEDEFELAQLLDAIVSATRRPAAIGRAYRNTSDTAGAAIRSPSRRHGGDAAVEVTIGAMYAMAMDAALVGDTRHVVTYDTIVRSVVGRRRGFAFGMDTSVGAGLSGGLAYRFAVLFGVGWRFGRASYLAATGGGGLSGIAWGRVPFALEAPVELYLSTPLSKRRRLAFWLQPRWVTADARQDGSDLMPFAHEVTIGAGLGWRAKRGGSATRRTVLSLMYQETMGTRFVGLGIAMSASNDPRDKE